MLSYIVLGVVALLAVLAIVIAMQPKAFRVARTVTMRAPSDAIFPHMNDMRAWLSWSPWEKVDPTMKRSYSGPASGVGQGYSWVGNKNIGEGRCTIVESRPNDLVRLRLEFIKPFRAVNDAEFLLKPVAGGTSVTWSMAGERNFMFKAIGLVFNADKMCGGAFEQGLNDLKQIVENEQTSPSRSPKLVASNA